MNPPAFQQFQREFAWHVRDPRRRPRPAGVPARRMAVYDELLFNNLSGFLDACFPVCREVLGEARWRRLSRSFYRDWRCRTPWFREIPKEFVNYLHEHPIRQALPRWLADLAHYEWVELAVDTMAADTPLYLSEGDIWLGRPVLNPAMFNLRYDWPVHRIGVQFRPRRPTEAYLLVYRDAADRVRFAEINGVTSRLLALLGKSGRSGREACLAVAAEMAERESKAVLEFGPALLDDLRERGIILGALP